MANSKNTKNTKQKQKASAAPKNTKSARSKQEAEERAYEEEVRRQENTARIMSIAIFAASLLFFFITVLPGEGAWLEVHKFFIGLFGWFAAVTFPLLCLVYSALFTVKKADKKMTFEIVSIVVLVMMISALIHVVQNTSGNPFGETVKTAYHIAPSTFNGGFFGALIGWLLLTFGKAPAIIVNLLVMLVDILLLSKVTINQFFRGTAKPVKKVVEKATPYIEERRERRQSRNIDIPLGDPADGDFDGSVTDNQGDSDIAAEYPDDDPTTAIIRDINAASERLKKRGEAAAEDSAQESTAQKKKGKSLDEIVADASKGKQEADKKNPADDSFSVSEDEMNARVEEYVLPPVSLLKPAKKKSAKDISSELKNNGQLLVDTLHSFGVSAEITDISRGPTVTRYELKPSAGVRISRITNLADDIALNLAAMNVRIEAPIPGKAAVGIEIPNKVKEAVNIREIVDTDEFKKQTSLLSAGLGKDISGNTVFCNVAKMPHLLIAGTTGSGKSVCMNSIIVSILYRARPDQVKFLMIDPKKVEFAKYENIPHLLVPVVTEPRKASGALGWAVSEMLKRYQAFQDTGVRDISGYNRYVQKHPDMQPMPQIVICIDELADLMMAAPKEVESSICRLAQMARAAGMHLVIATQRPSVDVITGLIKSNISSRIALTVSSQVDSRTILDAGGAEKLLGYGDMLYSPIDANKPVRVQGCYVSDEEVEALCDFIKKQGESEYSEEIQKEIDSKAAQEKGAGGAGDDGDDGDELDPLFDKAVEVVLENGRASTSFLQRKLSVGYSRGSKIMDQLEERGIIGPQDGAKPREIRINMQQWIQMKAQGPAPEFTAENTEQMSFDEEKAEAFDDSDFDE